MSEKISTKEKVLNILEANMGVAVSGEKLAAECGISRAAIWKAINSLREKGCNIEGTTNGGYLLKVNSDLFTEKDLLESLKAAYPNLANCHTECFSEIDSTNTYAKRLLTEPDAGKKYHKAIIVAESQTAGRGRLGRTFYSPSKTGIYLSVIYTPEGGITQPARLTAFSAVAICRVLKRLYNVDAQIKWINDIYINGKKVAGILTEGVTNFETAQIESAIIGIGINIADNPEVFPAEVAAIAGSITGNNSNTVKRTTLAAEIAGEVINILEEDPKALIKEYKDASFLLGTEITVHPIIGDNNSTYTAKAVDIADDAGLVVELPDGTTKILNSGEVSLHSVLRV